MKKFLILWGIIALTASVQATQLKVVGEIITMPGCGPCLPARSALLQMYEDVDNFEHLIPLIWTGSGEYRNHGYRLRSTLYSVSSVPYSQWGGLLSYSGAGADVYDQYVRMYNQLVSNPSPIALDIGFEINPDNQLVITAEVELLESISTTQNMILFLVTYNLEDELPGEHYFANVLRYSVVNFPLNMADQTGIITHSFDIDTWWDLAKANAVVMIQSYHDEKTIYQAETLRLDNSVSQD